MLASVPIATAEHIKLDTETIRRIASIVEMGKTAPRDRQSAMIVLVKPGANLADATPTTCFQTGLTTGPGSQTAPLYSPAKGKGLAIVNPLKIPPKLKD